jgi:hypothetical protein
VKNYARVGKRNGKPAYRTASSFRFCRFAKAPKVKAANRKLKSKNIDPVAPFYRVIRVDGKSGGQNRGAAQEKMSSSPRIINLSNKMLK